MQSNIDMLIIKFESILKYIWRFRAALGYMQYGELEWVDAWDISRELLNAVGYDQHPVRSAYRDVLLWEDIANQSLTDADININVPCETQDIELIIKV